MSESHDDTIDAVGSSAPRPLRIAVIAGDGIGPEVIDASIPVLEKALQRTRSTETGDPGSADDTTNAPDATRRPVVQVEWHPFPWGCDHYHETGQMMPDDGLDQLRPFDAIYFGAVGRPDVPDHISVHDLILPIRRHFDQYINLRPMKLLPGVPSPLAGRTPADLDMVCVRENSEGEYLGAGGRFKQGTPDERAEQTGIFTRRGIERTVRFAFELASRRPDGHVASATKSNALQHSMVLWDEVTADVAADFPDVSWRPYHVDALAARMVTHPQTLDVIVGSNLFGDILTDLGAAITGSLGLAPGANLNPEREHPSMFEPIHGSAPDIMGRGIANPIGTIWAGALMLEHLGLDAAARGIVRAIERTLADPDAPRTPDLGGSADTIGLAEAVAERLD